MIGGSLYNLLFASKFLKKSLTNCCGIKKTLQDMLQLEIFRQVWGGNVSQSSISMFSVFYSLRIIQGSGQSVYV